MNILHTYANTDTLCDCISLLNVVTPMKIYYVPPTIVCKVKCTAAMNSKEKATKNEKKKKIASAKNKNCSIQNGVECCFFILFFFFYLSFFSFETETCAFFY